MKKLTPSCCIRLTAITSILIENQKQQKKHICSCSCGACESPDVKPLNDCYKISVLAHKADVSTAIWLDNCLLELICIVCFCCFFEIPFCEHFFFFHILFAFLLFFLI